MIRFVFLAIALTIFTLTPGNKPVIEKQKDIQALVADFLLQWRQLGCKKLPDIGSPTMTQAISAFSKDPNGPNTPGHRLMDHFILIQTNQAER